MSNSENPDEACADCRSVPSELPSDTTRLKMDMTGTIHYHSRIAQTIAVVAADGSVHRKQLGERAGVSAVNR